MLYLAGDAGGLPDLAGFANLWPAWVALLVSGVIFFNRMVEESAKFASFFGGWAKRRNERAKQRHHLDLQAAEFADAVQKAIENARVGWAAGENEALQALDARLDTVSDVTRQQKADLDELRFQVRALTAYSEYEAGWHHRLMVRLAQSKDQCLTAGDIPSHLDYWQFAEAYRANQKWQDWADKTNGK